MKCKVIIFVTGLFLCASAAFSQASASFGGRATDSSGNVIVGATIRATNLATNQSWTVTTDSSGVYRFTDLPPGRYSVVLESSGFKSVSREVETRVGQSSTVDFILDPEIQELYAVRGYVTDRKSRPQSNALVTIKNERNEKIAEVQTDAQGRYLIDRLKDSKVSITIQLEGFQSVVKNVTLRRNSTKSVRHKLRPEK